MPLNTLRLNHQISSHPNERIVFIKPLPRPPAEKAAFDTAELILKAIAAQCLPIMKDHHLSVTTLEEYEPNPEFIGRNFNNGEIIQLVIQSKSGAWLPQNMIQMVMMHELAHNTHMNHGKGFWQTRNLYSGEMKALWARGYTGEGLWGRGRTLNAINSVIGNNTVPSQELADLPLCGGTYRSRRRKRKPKNDLTWKEKRDRRIEKKFGKNGVALGDDEDKRLSLEINRRGPVGVKPRVAQSKRGRELRAAAALARFETNKVEVKALESVKSEESDVDEEEYEEVDTDEEDAKDIDGKTLVDSDGRGMVKVCEEENEDDIHVKQEMDELMGLGSLPTAPQDEFETDRPDQGEISDRFGPSSVPPHNGSYRPDRSETPAKVSLSKSNISVPNTNSETGKARSSISAKQQKAPPKTTLTCPVCSMDNENQNTTCVACAHVLDPQKDPRHWKCESEACKSMGNTYVNGGDCGVCGICGARRP